MAITPGALLRGLSTWRRRTRRQRRRRLHQNPDDLDYDRGHCDCGPDAHLANFTVGYLTPQFDQRGAARAGVELAAVGHRQRAVGRAGSR